MRLPEHDVALLCYFLAACCAAGVAVSFMLGIEFGRAPLFVMGLFVMAGIGLGMRASRAKRIRQNQEKT